MKAKSVLSIFLAALLLLTIPGSLSLAEFTGNPPKVIISNMKIYKPSYPNNEELAFTANADYTEFTVNDTKNYDFETLSHDSTGKILGFNTNCERTTAKFSAFHQFLNYYCYDQFNYLNANVLPYDTDPDYIIAKFSLYVTDMQPGSPTLYKPIDSTKTDFTLKLKKWERQYQEELVNHYFNTSVWLGEQYSSGTWNSNGLLKLSAGNFSPVSGKPNMFECIVAKDVSLPYERDIMAGVYFQTTCYIDGIQITGTEAANGVKRRLKFTQQKPYFDFKIVPSAALNTKHTTYQTTTWRISVTGKDGSGGGGTVKEGETSLSAASVATLSDTAYTGKQISPAVKLNLNGKTLVKDTDYSVQYGTNKNIGKGTVKLTGKGKYTGSKTITFKIVPKKNSITKIAAARKQMKVTWSKVSSAQKISKYQLRYRTKGTSAWTTKTYASSLSSATIKNLKKGKYYEVQARSYKTVSGVKYYSVWSATKTSAKIK